MTNFNIKEYPYKWTSNFQFHVRKFVNSMYWRVVICACADVSNYKQRGDNLFLLELRVLKIDFKILSRSEYINNMQTSFLRSGMHSLSSFLKHKPSILKRDNIFLPMVSWRTLLSLLLGLQCLQWYVSLVISFFWSNDFWLFLLYKINILKIKKSKKFTWKAQELLPVGSLALLLLV